MYPGKNCIFIQGENVSGTQIMAFNVRLVVAEKLRLCHVSYNKTQDKQSSFAYKHDIFSTLIVRPTQGVNFINIIRTNFSYELRFSSYVLSFEKFVQKTRAYNVDEID